ncbi:MAG: PilZ domain-containing protein [SAR324 cluster bacterium]|nr:PilZ domain-containing protein [SAR324 cluster bacterium]MCZ6628426.1 PilZ domain-containing protein [SAR324 cluster bacterium]
MEFDGIDRRQFERVPLDPELSILIDRERIQPLRDISVGGLCFYSDQHFMVGRELSVGNRVFHVAARVIDCTPGSFGGDSSLYRHAVRCEFVPTSQRMQEQMLVDYVLRGIGAFAANRSV